jgi:hypothetical protein
VRRGDAALFLGYSNYPAFVDRAELRVFAPDAPLAGPPHAVVEADRNGLIRWTPSTYAGDAMRYVYRVYDREGRFDETAPQPLTVLSAVHLLPAEPVARADLAWSIAQRSVSSCSTARRRWRWRGRRPRRINSCALPARSRQPMPPGALPPCNCTRPAAARWRSA